VAVAVSVAFVAGRSALGVDVFGRDDLGEPVGGDADVPLAVVDEPVVSLSSFLCKGPVGDHR
jgi:hypothetical protein